MLKVYTHKVVASRTNLKNNVVRRRYKLPFKILDEEYEVLLKGDYNYIP